MNAATALAPIALLALVALLAAGVRPRAAIRRAHVARRPRRAGMRPPTAHQWAALLDSIAAEVRTGSSLATAVQHAVGHAQLPGGIVVATSLLPDAGTEATTNGGTPAAASSDEAVVVHALHAAHALGGPMASTLDAASALLRERAAIRAEAHAYSAQARLSARVLTAVPLVFAAWSLGSSRSFRSAVLSQFGLASTAAGALCNLAGWWWMRQIVGKAAA